MERSIIVKQFLDYETGELKQQEKVFIKKSKDNKIRFTMINITDDIGKFQDLTGNEIKMLIEFLAIENNNIVSITDGIRDEIVSRFKFTLVYYRTVVNSLVDKLILAKKTKHDFVINPCYFYKGSSDKMEAKLDIFNKYSKIPQKDLHVRNKKIEVTFEQMAEMESKSKAKKVKQ